MINRDTTVFRLTIPLLIYALVAALTVLVPTDVLANVWKAGGIGSTSFHSSVTPPSGVTFEDLLEDMDNIAFAVRACPTCYTTADGNDINVNSWIDESGNSFTPTAGSSATYPDYNFNGLGTGIAAIVWNGVDNKLQKLATTNIGNNFFEVSDIGTVSWYGKFDLSGSNHVGLFEVGSGSLNTGFQVYVHGTTDNMMVRMFQKDGSYTYADFNVAAYDDEPHLWTFEFNAPTDNIKVRVDNVDIGVSVTRSDGSSAAEELPDTINAISLGNPHTSYDFQGAVGLIIMTSDVQTSGEVANILKVASGGTYSAELLPTRYVVVGDSLSVDPASGGYDPSWPAIIEGDNPDIAVINEAIAGQTAATIFSNYASQIGLNYKSGAESNNLIILAGTNDISTGSNAATTYASITSIVNAATTTGYSNIYVCTIIDRSPDTYDAVIASTNTLIRAGSGYTVIDLAAVSELSNGANTTYFYDGVHPKEAGHEKIADTVKSITGLSMFYDDLFITDLAA